MSQQTEGCCNDGVDDAAHMPIDWSRTDEMQLKGECNLGFEIEIRNFKFKLNPEWIPVETTIVPETTIVLMAGTGG